MFAASLTHHALSQPSPASWRPASRRTGSLQGQLFQESRSRAHSRTVVPHPPLRTGRAPFKASGSPGRNMPRSASPPGLACLGVHCRLGYRTGPPLVPPFRGDEAVQRPEPRQSPGPLRPVRGVPALRLRWRLRRLLVSLVDRSPPPASLPRSHRCPRRSHVGSGYQKPQAALCGIPSGGKGNRGN